MERVILLVSVGNGPALAALADGLAAGRPDAAVRRVCSGGHGAALDAALARLRDEGIAWVDVQPLMLLPGHEYDRLRAALDSRRAEFARLRLGLPLLTGVEDARRLAAALSRQYPAGEGSLLLAGHGSRHPAGRLYGLLQQELLRLGREDARIALLTGAPGPAQVFPLLQGWVRLVPLMLEAGRHAACDLAGGHPASWLARLCAAGLETEYVPQGLAALPEVEQMFREKLELLLKIGDESIE